MVRPVVLEKLGRQAAFRHIAAWAKERVDAAEQEKFREVAEDEVLGLREGNFARYQVSLAQFRLWQQIWNPEDDLPA